MTKKVPRYLKLHVEEHVEHAPSSDEIALLRSSCEAFAQVTGWPMHFQASGDAPADAVWMMTIGQEGQGDAGKLYVAPAAAQSAAATGVAWPLSRERMEPLAGNLGQLLSEIQRLRCAVWQREAELATGIPVSARNDEREHLALRLQSVLQGGAEAIGCQAAALYLLDDATSCLKLRACWGLPQERLLEPPRPLRGAVADLEALVGHAVVLEDAELLPHWNVPELFPSAVCVPVSSPTNPLGTLWFYCDQRRNYTAQETNLVEIVAGRLASDLEREVLLSEGLHAQQFAKQMKFASHWQMNRLPSFAPLVPGWSVAGWQRQAELVGGDFYDWSILPDGSLSIAVGDAEGTMLEAALTATTVQTSLKSHANYQHNAKQMIERIDETLWTASAGDQYASLFYARIDDENGQVEFCSAGRVQAYHLGINGTVRINTDSPPLGTQSENAYRKKQVRLHPGEALLIITEGACQCLDDQLRPLLEQALAYCQQHREATAQQCIEAITPPFESATGDNDRTIVIVRRSK